MTSRWPEYSPRKVSPRMKPSDDSVVWLYAKYAVDANLFRLESSILTRAKRATNRNTVGGECSKGNFPVESIPRTENIPQSTFYPARCMNSNCVSSLFFCPFSENEFITLMNCFKNTTEHKFLGLMLYDKLKFIVHIKSLCKKKIEICRNYICAFQIFIITMPYFYLYTLVYPYFMHCSLAWGQTYASCNAFETSYNLAI